MSTPGVMRAECHNCFHVWAAVHLPMRLATVASVLRGLHCPKCGTGSERIFVHEPEADKA